MLVLDLDDTLCVFNPTVLELIGSEFDILVDPASLSQSWITDTLNEEQQAHLFSLIRKPSFYAELPLVFSSQSVLDCLHEAHKEHGVTYITGRREPLGDAAEEVTRAWLELRGLPQGELIVCHHTDNKVELMPSNTRLVFEDSILVTRAAEERGYAVGMVSWPWNQNYILSNPLSCRILPVAGTGDLELERQIGQIL